MSTADRLLKQRRYTNSAMCKMQSLISGEIEHRASGQYLYSESGEKFLNLGGFGVLLLGGAPADVVEAVTAQMKKLAMGSRVLAHGLLGEAAESLLETQGSRLSKVVFSSTGAEAIETAIKVTRSNGCNRVISMIGGFHGKSTGALALSGNASYKAPFRPLMDVEQVAFDDLTELEASLSQGGRSAVFLEPIQGESGVRIPSVGYLAGVAQLCQKHDAILVVDEIQTGLGRLGNWWEFLDANINPDIVLSGKVLSGGVFPVAATSVTTELYSEWDKDPVLHSSTYGGSPAACATVLSVIEKLRREKVPEAAQRLGDELSRILAPMSLDPDVHEVRGKGLLWGIEFLPGVAAGEFLFHCLDYGVLPSTSLNSSTVVRFTPPYCLNSEDLQQLSRVVTGWLELKGRR